MFVGNMRLGGPSLETVPVRRASNSIPTLTRPRTRGSNDADAEGRAPSKKRRRSSQPRSRNRRERASASRGAARSPRLPRTTGPRAAHCPRDCGRPRDIGPRRSSGPPPRASGRPRPESRKASSRAAHSLADSGGDRVLADSDFRWARPALANRFGLPVQERPGRQQRSRMPQPPPP